MENDNAIQTVTLVSAITVCHSTAGGHKTNESSPIVATWPYIDAESQISREGVRYQLPSDEAKLSHFITMCLDTEEIDDGCDDTD